MSFFDPMATWMGLEIVDSNPTLNQLLRFTGPDHDIRSQNYKVSTYDLIAEFTNFCNQQTNITGLVLTNPHANRFYTHEVWGQAFGLQAYASYWSHGEIRKTSREFWEIIIALIENKPKLEKLQHLFLNDSLTDFSEVSYLCVNGQLQVLNYFPNLKSFGWRGRVDLDFEDTVHESLEYLELQGTGLRGSTLRDLRDHTLFPALKGLACYFGDTESHDWEGHAPYAFQKTDVKELLDGKIYPNLTHVGLCNLPYDAEIGQWVIESPLPLESISFASSTIDEVDLKNLLSKRPFKKVDVQKTYVPIDFQLEGVDIFNIPRSYLSKHRYAEHHE